MTRFLFVLFTTSAIAAPIDRVWLSHADNDPSWTTVSWQTQKPGDSVVEYGSTPSLGKVSRATEKVSLHHLKIPTKDLDSVVYYRVQSGKDHSTVASFKTCPSKVLRVAVVGDWGYAMTRDVSAIQHDDVHLLFSVGDNVPSLHEGQNLGTQAFGALIDSQPTLFRSTPFMPILGNHDRELTSRGPKPPVQQVYDVEAKAFCEFFALPSNEWRWSFDVPAFDARFIALDLSHIQDFGTTWQTCHSWQAESDQFKWYEALMAQAKPGYVLTLMNEKQTQLNGLTKGAWLPHLQKSSALISGFGYFADRAELASGLPYFNTCLKGDGDAYKDPQSKFFAREDNYLLLTFTKDSATMKVQFKNLRGVVLDTREIARRR